MSGLAVGLGTWPDARAWVDVAVLAAAFVPPAAVLALAGGLINVPPGTHAAAWRTLALPFLAPGLLEECVFRGLLLPHPRRSGLSVRRRARWWAGSLAVYVAAHPLVAALARPAARGVFDSFAFLLEAALLGVAATALYERSGSLWPGVLLHGAVVAAWLNLGGAALLAR
ncbi:MAG: CPBP family glutamic-type intramembrane protease [Deinococcales bacterium]